MYATQARRALIARHPWPKWSGVFVVAALFLSGCAKPSAPVPGAFAVSEPALFINGVPVDESVVNAVIAGLSPERRAMVLRGEAQQQLEGQLVVGELLYQAAIEHGLHELPEQQTALAMAARDVLANAEVERIKREAVSDADVEAAYASNTETYGVVQYNARHILVSSEERALELLAELNGGADFAAVAKANSEDPGTQDLGGELGWFQAEQMVPAFAEAASTAEVGAFVGPVKSPFGQHILQVTDTRAAIPLEDVQDEIRTSLEDAAVNRILKEMREAAVVTYPNKGAQVPSAPEAP